MQDSTILFLAYIRYKSQWQKDANLIREDPMSHHEFIVWWTDRLGEWWSKYGQVESYKAWE